MNKTIKIILAAGIACCIFGVILYGIGRAAGGNRYMQDADLDSFENGGRREVLELKKEKLDDFEKIDADIRELDVMIKPSGDDSCYLSYRIEKRRGRNPLTYGVEGDTLRLTEENAGGAFRYVRIGIDLNSLIFYSPMEADMNTVTIYVPEEKMFDSCEITLRDGDARIEQLHSKEAKLELESGDLQLKGASLETAVLNLRDGDVSIEQLHSKEAKLKLESGDLQIEGSSFETAVLNLRDGDLSADRLSVSGQMDVESKSGDVSVHLASDKRENLRITAETKNGEVDAANSLGGSIGLDNDGDAYKYERDAERPDGYLTIHCVDGDISIR